jgi:hypothetical protein
MDEDFEDALYVLDLMQKSSSVYSTTFADSHQAQSLSAIAAMPMPKAKRPRLSTLD